MAKHVFLIIGLATVAYFFVIDLETLRPRLVDYAIFIVGFIAMAIYVVQSFMRFRRQQGGSGGPS